MSCSGFATSSYSNHSEKLTDKEEQMTDNGEPEVVPTTIRVITSGTEEVFANRLATITLGTTIRSLKLTRTNQFTSG